MDQGWFRSRWVALTSAGCAALAVIGRLMLVLGAPERSPEPWRIIQAELADGLPIGVRIAAFLVLVVAALIGATVGVAALASRPGRLLGVTSVLVCLVVLFVGW